MVIFTRFHLLYAPVFVLSSIPWDVSVISYFSCNVTFSLKIPRIVMLYTHNTIACIQIYVETVDNDELQWTNKHFFIKSIYLSHFILNRVMFLLCVRDELETGTDCYIDPKFFDHSSSLSSWLGCSTVGHWGPQHAGILSPTDSNRPWHLVILLSHVHLLPLFFGLFTQVHL